MCQNINFCAFKNNFARGSVIFSHFCDRFFLCVVSKSYTIFAKILLGPPLTLVKAITLAHLVAVQSLRIFKILTKTKKMKIPELWKATKCAKIITLTKVKGVLHGIKQNISKVP